MGRHKKITVQKKMNDHTLEKTSSKLHPETPVIPSDNVQEDVNRIITETTEKKLDQELPTTRKYTRRKAMIEEEEKQRQAIEATARSFAVVVYLGLNFLSSRLPNPIPPSEEEIEAINQAVTAEMAKLIPSVDRWKEELLLAGTLIMFFIPRLKRQKSIIHTMEKLHESGQTEAG